MNTPSRFPRFAILAAALALCLQAPLCAEEKPAPVAKGGKLSAEDEKLMQEAREMDARAVELYKHGNFADAEQEWRKARTSISSPQS